MHFIFISRYIIGEIFRFHQRIFITGNAAAVRMNDNYVIFVIKSFLMHFINKFVLQSINNAGVKLVTLSNYYAMLEVALQTEYITKDDLETLHMWRKDPANWTPVR